MLKNKKFWIIFAAALGAVIIAVTGTLLHVYSCFVNLDDIKFSDMTVTYDGAEHEVLISGELPKDFTVEYENNKLTNVGTTEATATISNQYGKVKKQVKANLTIAAPASVTLPVPETLTFTYTGSEITLGIAPHVLYTVVSGDKATESGKYSAVVSLTDKNYSWFDNTKEDKTISWEIQPQKIDVPTLTGEYIYNGEEQTAQIEESALYALTGNKQTNVGAYNVGVSLTDKRNYRWSDGTAEDKSLLWIIQRCSFDVSQYVQFNDTTLPYNGEEQFITLTGTLPEGITAIYSGNSGKEIGTYKAYVYFEVDNNFNEIDSLLSAVLTIEKGNYDMSVISFEDTEFYFDRTQHTLEVTGTLPQGVSVSYVNNTLTGEQNRTVTQRATAIFKGDTQNYNTIPEMSAEITVKPLVLSITFETEGGKPVDALRVNRYTLLSEAGVESVSGKVVREGYTFVDWTYENGGEIDYSAELLEDTVLYANWTAKHYSVVLNADGGTFNDEVASYYSFVYDGQFALPAPVKDNYTFIGYADKETYSNFITEEKINGNTWVYDLSSTETENELIAIWTYNEPLKDAMSVSYAGGKVVISVTGLGTGDDSFYNIYAVSPESYYYADSVRGMSSFVDNGSDVVAVYKGGERQRFEFNRNGADGTDYLFKKYYVVKGDEIVKGPVYANDIEAKNYAEGPDGYGSWEIKSKKGVANDSVSTTLDLDCHYTAINLVVTGIVVPNEYVDSAGNVLPVDNSEEKGLIAYPFNGTTYYYREGMLSGYDSQIKEMTENHVKVTLVVYAIATEDQNILPYFMTYPSARGYTGSPLTAINTSNPLGAMYWAAFMSFIADRYSGGEYGYVQSYVIGNEVDYADAWNPVVNFYSERSPSLEAYTEEYYRELRIADIAVKSADKDLVVLTSFTHYWTSKNSDMAYGPYYMSELLIEKSREQGNFNWGYAMHPYAPHLTASDIFNDGTSDAWYFSDSFKWSNEMTYLNFEQMQDYLDQDYMLFDGKNRPVYTTEGGVSSANNSINEQRQQAAGIAYSYYKVSMLDCVVALIYYRGIDIPSEGARFGLLNEYGEKKVAYEMWKNIDKFSPDTYTEYLTSCNYQSPSGSGNTVKFSEEDDYLSAMKKMSTAFGIEFDWDSRWNKVYGTNANN